MSLNTRLLKLPNPFFRIKKGLTRYMAITATIGTLSFAVALAMLHCGYSPFISLTASVLASGLFGYALLELWGFPHRSGRLCWSRLVKHAAVGTASFAARWAALTAALFLFKSLKPYDNAIALVFAFAVSFGVGYLLRRYVVFKH